MANQTVMTAVCQCSFGLAPCPLPVSSQATVSGCKQLCATTMDNKLPTFGMCTCQANPAVAAATAAALGTPTPAPCTPVIAAPWSPGCATVTICGNSALNDSSKLNCSYGGVISINMTPAMGLIQIP